MKKNYLLFTVSAFLIVMISSCSKDENSETCHPCHLEAALWADIVNADGDTIAHEGDIEIWDIANSEGEVGGDFCDQEKEDAESSNFVYSFPTGALTGDFFGVELTQEYYDEHSDDFVVHCEEHEGDDHDDHDHDHDDHDDHDDDDDDHDDDDHDDGGGK